MRVRLDYGVHANMNVCVYVNVILRSNFAICAVLGIEVPSSLSHVVGHVQLEACWKTMIGNISPRRASFEPMAIHTDLVLLENSTEVSGLRLDRCSGLDMIFFEMLLIDGNTNTLTLTNVGFNCLHMRTVMCRCIFFLATYMSRSCGLLRFHVFPVSSCRDDNSRICMTQDVVYVCMVL